MAETTEQFANRLGIEDGLKDINQMRIVRRSDGKFYAEISVHSKAGWHTLPNSGKSTYEQAEAEAFHSFTGSNAPEGNVVGSHNGEFVTGDDYHLETDMGYGEPEDQSEGIVHGWDPNTAGGGSDGEE